ncbi:hypothetical protein [Chitinophaga rhizosphaerae]|uniref:hypothetical protein n=1 Tax=Chitinophaga rhizosphaerae TaxID=1864947 RepID=UPI000F80CAB0|nr:hypothetical protein [Chitinophaga rhizosphaerae]
MVTIKNFKVHADAQGKSFVSLELIGDIEMIQSKQSGRFYATVRKCFISSTFDETTARLMVGKSIEGNIVKQECEPYDFIMHETGEAVKLTHQYAYVP